MFKLVPLANLLRGFSATTKNVNSYSQRDMFQGKPRDALKDNSVPTAGRLSLLRIAIESGESFSQP